MKSFVLLAGGDGDLLLGGSGEYDRDRDLDRGDMDLLLLLRGAGEYDLLRDDVYLLE